MLVENRRGGYSFLKGIAPYSAGAVALPGFEIERARLMPAPPLKQGFEAVERHLAALGRPKQALCGMELRSPRPFTFQGFADFNAGYVGVLKAWDIFIDGLNPVARTNVAIELSPVPVPSLYAFTYTVPARDAHRSFVVAGAGELPEGSLDPHDVVRRGETSPDAIAEKARFVMGLMNGRLRELGGTWDGVTAVDVYTVHDMHALWRTIARPEVTWHYARPPIVSIEYEMDLRASRREVVLWSGARQPAKP